MSDSRSLGTLKRALAEALNPRQVASNKVWGDPQAMSRVLLQIKQELGGNAQEHIDKDAMTAALVNFRSQRSVASFNELKYVCYGACVPLGTAHWRLIDDAGLVTAVLDQVDERQKLAKQFRRCYQGLLSAYFTFDKNRSGENLGLPNWQRLREYLGTRLDPVRIAARRRDDGPEWLGLLHQNRNLLSEDPCSSYAGMLSVGDTSGLRAVCEGLGIASSSWVWEDALMAYVRLVCKGSDAAFREGLPGVLQLVNGKLDLKLPHMLARRSTAMSVSRYAACADKPEHPDLRDTSTHWIGNPWLNRAAWDAEVKSEAARKMVEGWLKRRLIRDFFELLARHNGAVDQRRLHYWLRWEPHISDMWFVLGSDAQRNQTTEFKEFRRRLEGRGRRLNDADGANNAFVMRIGPLLVIEFGLTGNACYVFRAEDFMTDLDTMEFTLNRDNPLKQKAGAERWRHASDWESKFDADMARLLGSRRRPEPAASLSTQTAGRAGLAGSPAPSPARAPAPAPAPAWQRAPAPASAKIRRQLSDFDLQQLQMACKRRRVAVEDRRDRDGGALWVRIEDREQHPGLCRTLEAWGFRFAEGKGFWFKDE